MKTHVVLHGIQVGVKLYTVEADTSSQAAQKALDLLVDERALATVSGDTEFANLDLHTQSEQQDYWTYHVDGDISCQASVFDPREWDKPAVEKWIDNNDKV